MIRRLLRFFFLHFYHGFAWTYDFVASVVSLGRWNTWVEAVLPYVHGPRVLEIGHGPGHLQARMLSDHFGFVAGLDESPQMIGLTRKRIARAGLEHANLTRGVAQALPFAAESYDTVVSTFPAEYIFEHQTLCEVRRVLTAGGQFVMMPASWIVGAKLMEKAAAWLFRITDQAPEFPPKAFLERIRGPYVKAGFDPELLSLEMGSSVVLIVIARKA